MRIFILMLAWHLYYLGKLIPMIIQAMELENLFL